MIEEYHKIKTELSVSQKKIAKQIYDEMKAVTDKWQCGNPDIFCNWEGVITVDDYTYDHDDFYEETGV